MADPISAIVATWAAITAATATFVTALTFGSGLMAALSAWSTVASVVSLGAALLMKPPSLGSAGQQVNLQLAGPNAPIPFIFGRTGTQGVITYRETGGGGNNPVLWVDTILSVGPIKGVQSFSVMNRALGYSGNPHTGMATVTSVQGVDMRASKLFRENGLRFAHRNGAHNDNSTLSTICGESVPKITSAHRLSGLAHTIIRCDLDKKQLNFPNGFPDDPLNIVDGLLCYDPRQDSTYPGGSGSHRLNDVSTRTWSENPAIIALNFALGWWSPQAKMVGMGAEFDQIDAGQFVNAANVCDANGWTCGGQATTADNRWAVLTNILAAGGMVPTNRGGRLGCFVRSPKVSSFTLRTADVLGSRKITTTTPIKERSNRIIPSCLSPAHGYQIIAGEAISRPEWLEQDHGDLRTTETTFPFVSNFRQAHQLATYEICDAREFLQLEVTAKARALAVEVGDCIQTDLAEFAPGQKWIVLDRQWDATNKTVALTLKAETTEKHAFALGQSQTPPAPPVLVDFDPTNPPAPSPASWAISDNKIIGTRRYDVTPPVAEGEPPVPEEDRVYEDRDHSQIPALVVSGSVNNPNVVKTIIETRRYTDASTLYPDGIPAGMDPDVLAAEIRDTGWTHAAEGNQTVEQFVLAPMRANTLFEVAVSYQTNNGAFSQRTNIGSEITAEDIAGNVGDGTVGWNDPDGEGPIIGRPPVLNPGDPGYLDAALLRWGEETLGNALSDIETALGDLDNAVADLGNVVVDVDGAVANATADLVIRIGDAEDMAEAARNRADGLWTVVGENDGSGLRATVLALQKSQVGDLTAVTNRVTGLEQVVNATGAQALARQTDLDELEVALDGTYAKATDLSDLTTRVTTAEGVNSAQNTRLNTAETNIAGKASATDLTALTTRVTNAEGTVSSHNTRLNTAESDIAGKASATSVGNLQSEVTGARNGSANLAAQLGTMRQTVSDGLAGKASVTDVTSLTSRVGTAETNITGANTRIDNVVTDLAGKASTSSVTTLANEITGARNGSANLGAQLTTMRQTVTDGLAGKASATAMTNLTTRVGNAEGTITSHNGRLDAAESDIAGKASSSSVTTLSNEIVAARNGGTTLKSRIDGLQTSLTDAINLKASAQSVLDLSSEIANARGSGNATLSARFTQVNNTIVDGLAGKASASSVSTLSTKVDGFDSRITTAQSVAASADGKVNAKIGVVLDVNGLVSGYSSVNNGSTSSFNVNANTFNLLTPGNPGDRIELSGTTGFKMYKAGVRRIFFGFQ